MILSEGNPLIQFIQSKLEEATYISLLIFKNQQLIKSINNNYNNWANHYTPDDMKQDSVFYEISHKKLEKSDNTICFWNSIPHDSKLSQEIDDKRKKFGLYNGVTILESADNNTTLGINITSDANTDEDSFYAKVILNKHDFLIKLKDTLKNEAN